MHTLIEPELGTLKGLIKVHLRTNFGCNLIKFAKFWSILCIKKEVLKYLYVGNYSIKQHDFGQSMFEVDTQFTLSLSLTK